MGIRISIPFVYVMCVCIHMLMAEDDTYPVYVMCACIHMLMAKDDTYLVYVMCACILYSNTCMHLWTCSTQRVVDKLIIGSCMCKKM